MAEEQDFIAYPDQAFLAPTDNLVAAKANGSGVNIAGSHIFSRDVAGGPYAAAGNVSIANPAGTVLTLSSGVFTNDHSASIQYRNRQGAAGVPVEGQIGAEIRFTRMGTSANYRITFGTTTGAGGLVTDRWYIGETGHLRPSVDGSVNIGAASERVSVVYAATGTINTSDEREKEWIGALSDAEYAAGREIMLELGWYQWADAVAEKGKAKARVHFGVRAQRVFAILDRHLGEGAWRAFAFACYDAWDAEYAANPDGGEPMETMAAGDRYGLRLDQFTMFLIACQSRRIEELAANLGETQR